MNGEQFADAVLAKFKGTGASPANEHDYRLLLASAWSVVSPRLNKLVDAVADVKATLAIENKEHRLAAVKKSFVQELLDIQ